MDKLVSPNFLELCTYKINKAEGFSGSNIWLKTGFIKKYNM